MYTTLAFGVRQHGNNESSLTHLNLASLLGVVIICDIHFKRQRVSLTCFLGK